MATLAPVSHTPSMEPEAHRLDREALLADRQRIARHVQRQVDEAAAAAAEKRRSYLGWFVDHMRIEAQGEIERERRWADMRVALAARSAAAAERTQTVPAERRPGWEDVAVEPTPLARAVG